MYIIQKKKKPLCLCAWQDVLLDLMNQIRDLRSELSRKEEAFSHVSGDVKDITVHFTSHSFLFKPFSVKKNLQLLSKITVNNVASPSSRPNITLLA